MADNKQVTEQQKDEAKQDKNANWADIDEDEEDDNQDIGVQNEDGEKKEEATEAEEPKAEGGDKAYEGDKGPYKGKAGYKKNWKKGGVLEERKSGVPSIARQKNERGDYVVTNFVIPDRATKKEEKVRFQKSPQFNDLYILQEATKVSKKRVGAFMIDSDEEEEEEQVGETQQETEEPKEEVKVEEPKAECMRLI